jgi:hypothetical protein
VANVLEGWQAPIFQATAGPVMLGMIPQRLAIPLLLGTLLVYMLWGKLALLSVPIYGAAVLGTLWEPYWYNMLLEYWSYKTYYEG